MSNHSKRPPRIVAHLEKYSQKTLGNTSISLGGSWQKRTFVLTGDLLEWFLDEHAIVSQNKISVSEKTIIEFKGAQTNENVGPFEMHLTHRGGKVWKLRSRTLEGAKLFMRALGLAGAQVIPKEYGCAEEDSKQYLKLAEDFLHEPQEHDSSEEPEYVDTQAIRTNEFKLDTTHNKRMNRTLTMMLKGPILEAQKELAEKEMRDEPKEEKEVKAASPEDIVADLHQAKQPHAHDDELNAKAQANASDKSHVEAKERHDNNDKKMVLEAGVVAPEVTNKDEVNADIVADAHADEKLDEELKKEDENDEKKHDHHHHHHHHDHSKEPNDSERLPTPTDSPPPAPPVQGDDDDEGGSSTRYELPQPPPLQGDDEPKKLASVTAYGRLIPDDQLDQGFDTPKTPNTPATE